MLSVDHIGYAVEDIEKTAALYCSSGWKMSEIFDETVQNARIAFLTKDGFPKIELVSRLSGESPVDEIIRKNGVSPYHICYVVNDIMSAVEDLYAEGFRPLFVPVESVAMDGRKICYLFNSAAGYIELVEK